ncbi:MAG: DUF4935 domain-containing protein [Halothiobacillus sp.]|nr:DUF4935 domain-containing protein [Halothiobacillus sp.]
MRNTPKIHVFLDANVVIQEGRKVISPALERVVELVDGGFIDVYTTQLTKAEIAKKHIENDFNLIKDFGRAHVRERLNEVMAYALPAITKEEIRESLDKRYQELVESLFQRLNARTISIDGVKPSQVLDAYTRQTGFFSGEGKKDQFPDAFIFEALRTVATGEAPMVIISNDGDFDGPVRGDPAFEKLKTLPALFEKLGFEVDAPDVADFLKAHHDMLVELFDAEVMDNGIVVSDVDGAEIDESTVTEVQLGLLSVFRSTKDDGDILVTGHATLDIGVYYTHPDWDHASWDSEDKVAIPHQDVTGFQDVEVDTRFAMAIAVDENGDPSEITGVSLVGHRFGLMVSIQEFER